MFWCIFTYIIYKNSTSTHGWLTGFKINSLDELVLVKLRCTGGEFTYSVKLQQQHEWPQVSGSRCVNRPKVIFLIGMRVADKGILLYEIKIYIRWDCCFGFDWVCSRTVFLSTPPPRFRSHSLIPRDCTDTRACSLGELVQCSPIFHLRNLQQIDENARYLR